MTSAAMITLTAGAASHEASGTGAAGGCLPVAPLLDGSCCPPVADGAPLPGRSIRLLLSPPRPTLGAPGSARRR
eukprot:scaffold269890_cov39-Tisochrysis_lutea.AAC.2